MRHSIKRSGGPKQHDLAFSDFDGDGVVDIFCAEMRLGGRDPDARLMVFLGDGRGGSARW